MPKYAGRRRPTTYAPKRRSYMRGATTKKPYGGSRYGNDAFVKVEAIQPLAATVANQVFSTMRVCNGIAGTPGNTYLVN